MRALVAGWFSYENSDATAGDLLACDLVCEWLEGAGYSCDVARASPFPGGVSLELVNPADYSHAVFVCGPFMQNALEAQFLGRFADCFVVGVNVSLPVPLDRWNPFDLLLERDSSAAVHPDITFLTPFRRVPVVGLCLVEPYDEAVVPVANAAIARLVASREMATVPIDTRLDVNTTGLRTHGEVESLLARMDAVITTRLHGTVLALKHGVPALSIDPEAGGARIKRQSETLGWPAVFSVDALDTQALEGALDYCLSEAARIKAKECSKLAAALLETMKARFVTGVDHFQLPGPKHADRRAFAIAHGWRP